MGSAFLLKYEMGWSSCGQKNKIGGGVGVAVGGRWRRRTDGQETGRGYIETKTPIGEALEVACQSNGLNNAQEVNLPVLAIVMHY